MTVSFALYIFLLHEDEVVRPLYPKTASIMTEYTSAYIKRKERKMKIQDIFFSLASILYQKPEFGDQIQWKKKKDMIQRDRKHGTP